MDKSTRVICVYNQKGGVGKSTTAVNISQIMAEVKNKKTLLIDFDSQGTATLMCNIPTWDDSIPNIGQLISGIAVSGNIPEIDEILSCITNGTYIKNTQEKGKFGWKREEKKYPFDILPVCGADLSIGELAINNRQSFIYKHVELSYFMLKIITDKIVEECDYDYIIIDANPSLSMFAVNALVASDYMIIPTTMTTEAVNGIQSIFSRLEELNLVIPFFHPLGIVYQKFDGVRTLDKEILENTIFEEFKAKIPDVNSKISQSINDNFIPAMRTDKKYLPIRQAYIELVNEIEEKIYLYEKENGTIVRKGLYE